MEVKIIKKKNKEGLQEKKRTAKKREEYKKNMLPEDFSYDKQMAKVSPDVKMYLEHGKAFPGFDQSRRIRGGLKGGGMSQRGLGKAFKKGGRA
jgi:hypothetical protein